MEPVWIAAIAAIVAVFSQVVGPLLTARQINRARRIDRRDDYARQDVVAARAQEVAKDLLTSNARIAEEARIAGTVLIQVAKDAKATHVLVNSNMTEEMTLRLDSMRRELALMNEIVEMKKVAGQQPSEDILAAIDGTKATIAELRSKLDDRVIPPRCDNT